ncbi:hypothetical protein FE314_14435 [Priestia megaterium]|nr:hypothetical protein FE314_14435 [Priestia megaterium]MDR4219251.1 hypothetical protein [Priestia megaterium]QDZ88790.1 hypothetical protein D0441_04285 [Priestia megaterium]RFB31044.1 hypothetical protein DZB87_11410 [Bacillus sp. ALD]
MLALLRGLICSAVPAGVFALLSNQQLEATNWMNPTFTNTMKRSEQLLVRTFLKLTYFLFYLF